MDRCEGVFERLAERLIVNEQNKTNKTKHTHNYVTIKHTNTQTNTHAHTHAHTHARTHAPTYTHKHTHAHMHTHAYT